MSECKLIHTVDPLSHGADYGAAIPWCETHNRQMLSVNYCGLGLVESLVEAADFLDLMAERINDLAGLDSPRDLHAAAADCRTMAAKLRTSSPLD